MAAVGRDRPGIVAGITEALLEFGGNVDDSQMSILHGQFAVMLIVSVPDDTDVDAVSDRLDRAASQLGLGGVTATPVSDLDRGPGPTHVLTVYGPDRPGIVHDVASLLAAHGVNITDLRTRRTGSAEAPLYTMMMEVEVPEAGLGGALEKLSSEKGVEARLAELETEVI